MSKSAVIVTLTHCRKLKYCRSGIENFCGNIGIDFKDFCRNGVSSDRLEQYDDLYLNRLIDVARGKS